eukprot:7799393-Pyramimonas_sp.AAC.1
MKASLADQALAIRIAADGTTAVQEAEAPWSGRDGRRRDVGGEQQRPTHPCAPCGMLPVCLLYTSDAADDTPC